MNDTGFTIFNNNTLKAVGEEDVEMLSVMRKDGIKSSNKANNSKFLKTSLIQPGEEIYVAYDLRG